MCVTWIYVISHVHLSRQPLAVLCVKNLNVWHCIQTVPPAFVIPVILIGAVDFYHFIPLSLTLTLPGGHTVCENWNLLASFSPKLFIWLGWNSMWWWSSSSWTSWYYFWIKVIETREITAVLLPTSTNLNIGMHLDVCKSIWFKLAMMIGTIVLNNLILV